MECKTFEEANELYKSNSICKKGLTIRNLIIGGIITYEDWLDNLKYNHNSSMDSCFPNWHCSFRNPFGKKLEKFLIDLGWSGEFQFGRGWKKRTDDHHMESIKLIDLKIICFYNDMEEEDEG